MDLSQVRASAKQYGLLKLHQDSGVARSRLYDFVAGASLNAENLLKVLNCLGYGLKVVDLSNQQDLDSSLAFYGAPLPQKAKKPAFCLEDALLGALRKASHDFSYFEFVVYLLTRTLPNYQALLESATLPQQKQLLGYAADLGNALVEKNELKNLANELHLNYQKFSFLGDEPKGKYSSLRASLAQNSLGNKWNVKSDTTLDVLRERFAKWDRMNSKELSA